MPLGIVILITAIIAGGLGLLIGWLLGRGRATVVPADSGLIDELRQQAKQHVEKQRTLQEQLLALNQRNGELGAELKSLNERLATERQQLETIQEKFRKEFETVSTKLIADNTSSFNRQSAESLENLLKPLKEKLGEFKTSLDKTHDATTTNSALLKEQVSRIGAEAANLSKALKGDVKVLGNWGENMLDQILEKSGLQREMHYRRQRGAKDVEGDQRFLDVIVDLPDKRNLVIDSKVSLRAYEESVNAIDDPAKFAGLDRHVEALRKHFRDLGAKRYQDIRGINTPDFVLMYVPIEAAFFVAIAREPELFAEALDHNVVLITNSTLLATLRTVAHVWRLADQQKNVLEIADRGGKLYDKFVGFMEDLQAVGDSLGKARKAWEDASTKLHTGSGNLVSQTEKLKQLGAKAAKSLPNALLEKASEEITPADAILRLPPAA
ncbi:MAG TPA: DNA recombination protein RmuC [Verrucomicrobiae bacterium]